MRSTTRELPKYYEYTITKTDLGRWAVYSSIAGGMPMKIHSCKSRREALLSARLLAGRTGTIKFGPEEKPW